MALKLQIASRKSTTEPAKATHRPTMHMTIDAEGERHQQAGAEQTVPTTCSSTTALNDGSFKTCPRGRGLLDGTDVMADVGIVGPSADTKALTTLVGTDRIRACEPDVHTLD